MPNLLPQLRARLTELAGFRNNPTPLSSLVTERTLDQYREERGGNISLPAVAQTRWLLSHLETAEHQANQGRLETAARLWLSAQSDGVFAGVLSTRTSGLVRLPKVFRGNERIVAKLKEGGEAISSVFDLMFPSAELALLTADGIGLGVGVAELLPMPKRGFPRMVRHNPENLVYYQHENRWYLRTVAGLTPISPGDGRWILHIPGGMLNPWQSGIWRSVGRAHIAKQHAVLYDNNWMSKLANPARVAVSPAGSSEPQKQGWFQAVMAWGVNSVFGMTPGYDVKLVESNGRGAESFDRTIARSEREMIIAVAGNEVTADGGSGFQNNDIFESIKEDLIQTTADSLAFTLNTQGIPQWAYTQVGEEALSEPAIVTWDVRPPNDKNNEANTYVAAAAALSQLNASLLTYKRKVDIDDFSTKFNISAVDMTPEEVAQAELFASQGVLERPENEISE